MYTKFVFLNFPFGGGGGCAARQPMHYMILENDSVVK